MPTDKNKKEVKVRDLKPSKDAKGGFASKAQGGPGGHRQDGGGKSRVADGKLGGPNAQSKHIV